MGSIDKRPNGTWRARWREYAGGPQKTKAFDRKTDAQRFIDGVRGDLVRGFYIDPDSTACSATCCGAPSAPARSTRCASLAQPSTTRPRSQRHEHC